jgi:hypothetical protein
MQEPKSNEILFEDLLDEIITETIRKVDGKYCLFSKKTNPKTGKKRNLGCYGSKSGAEQREREVQYFKHK